MRKNRIKKILSTKVVSLLLSLSVIISLAVPFEITIFAEDNLGTVPVLAADDPISAEAQAASDDIRAYLCKINGSSDNLNLVFQNSAMAAPADALYGPYGGDSSASDYHFASKEYYKQWWYVDGNSNPSVSWQDSHSYADGVGIKPVFLPWHTDAKSGDTGYANKIKKITFKEEIKPLSIASWFYYLRYVESIEGLTYLNTENCRDMTYAFYNFCNGGNCLTELDLSHFDTSEVRQCNHFFKSDKIKKLNVSNFDFSHIGRVLKDVPYNAGGKMNTYVSAVWYFVYNSDSLTELKIDNVDLSGSRAYKYFVSNNDALLSLDLSNMKKGPEDAYTAVKGDSIKLSSAELFGNFKPEYAGTWVAVASIILDADGGTPDKQYLEENSKGMPLVYDKAAVTTPQKTGYTFDGWYSEKNGAGTALPDPNTTEAISWTYYANWIENTYTLVLDGNDGGTIKSGLTAAKVASDSGVALGDDPDDPRIVIDTEKNTITFKEIKYTEYIELNKNWFTSDTPDATILTGWGDRRNGVGDNFGVSESVSKLTPESGGLLFDKSKGSVYCR